MVVIKRGHESADERQAEEGDEQRPSEQVACGRRRVLQLVGGAVGVSTLGISGSDVAEGARAQVNSNGDRTQRTVAQRRTLLSDDFEEYSVGAFPNTWSRSGNRNQEVVEDPVASGDQSLKMSGAPGGCFQALAHYEFPRSIPRDQSIVFTGQINPTGDGGGGCHGPTNGVVSLQDSPASAGGRDHRQLLVKFENGKVKGRGDNLGSYNVGSYNSFEIEYYWDSDTDEIELTYQINGEERGTGTASATTDDSGDVVESELIYFTVTSGDYTIYIDNLGVESSGTSAPAEPALTAQNAVAVNDGTAYLISSGEILKVDLETRSVINQFQAPDGTNRGLAYGAGSLWYADAATDAFDGQILELNPDTGEVRSTINTGYDPYGLAFGGGSLWAGEVTGVPNNVYEFTPDGEQVDSFDIGGPAAGAPTGSSAPNGLAYANDSIWVGTGEELFELGSDGAVVQSIDEHNAGYKGLAGDQTALYGPDENGDLSVIRTFGDEGGAAVQLSVDSSATVQPGETLTFTVEVTNRDVSEASSGIVELTSVPDPLVVPSATENPVFLGVPGGTPVPAVDESVSQEFDLDVPEQAAIEQDLTLGAEAVLQNDTGQSTTTATQTVTIAEQQDPVERFDRNGEPGIQSDEVLDSISEFNEGGDVEATDVLDVISEFNENSR